MAVTGEQDSPGTYWATPNVGKTIRFRVNPDGSVDKIVSEPVVVVNNPARPDGTPLFPSSESTLVVDVNVVSDGGCAGIAHCLFGRGRTGYKGIGDT